jgi:hypothetical protein
MSEALSVLADADLDLVTGGVGRPVGAGPPGAILIKPTIIITSTDNDGNINSNNVILFSNGFIVGSHNMRP